MKFVRGITIVVVAVSLVCSLSRSAAAELNPTGLRSAD
jgi:hypothetical protein